MSSSPRSTMTTSKQQRKADLANHIKIIQKIVDLLPSYTAILKGVKTPGLNITYSYELDGRVYTDTSNISSKDATLIKKRIVSEIGALPTLIKKSSKSNRSKPTGGFNVIKSYGASFMNYIMNEVAGDTVAGGVPTGTPLQNILYFAQQTVMVEGKEVNNPMFSIVTPAVLTPLFSVLAEWSGMREVHDEGGTSHRASDLMRKTIPDFLEASINRDAEKKDVRATARDVKNAISAINDPDAILDLPKGLFNPNAFAFGSYSKISAAADSGAVITDNMAKIAKAQADGKEVFSLAEKNNEVFAVYSRIPGFGDINRSNAVKDVIDLIHNEIRAANDYQKTVATKSKSKSTKPFTKKVVVAASGKATIRVASPM